MSDVETEITPPSIDQDDDGGDITSGRLGIHWLDPDDTHYDAGVQLFGEHATDPDRFAAGLLDAALALASLRGSAYSWAVMQRFSRYDGIPSSDGTDGAA